MNKNGYMTWVEEVSLAFKARGGKATLGEIYDYIQQTTKRMLPKNWKAVIRQTIVDNSSDGVFRKHKDIFYSVGGKSSGWWGLRAREEKK